MAKITDLKPGDRVLFNREGHPTEVLDGTFVRFSPSGRYACLSGEWYGTDYVRILEEIPPGTPVEAGPAVQEAPAPPPPAPAS